MIFDRSYDGPQGFGEDDRPYAGSRFSEVRAALFANAYYQTWGGPGESGLPVYEVSIGRALRGLLGARKGWNLLRASRRTLASHADLRWGPDRRGFRRILHPNAVCLTGVWEVDDEPPGRSYTGYFKPGSRGLVVGRYSTCCTETRSGHYRSLSLVGKVYPTLDPDHAEPLRPANFITQEDLGGALSPRINDAELRNAPDTTPWRRGKALPVLLATGIALKLSDKEIAVRQLYPIAELGKPADEPTRSPVFMRLRVDPAQPVVEELDFRDEILGQIYDKGDGEPKRTLAFTIEVCDEGSVRGILVQRRTFKGWTRIGRIVFKEAVASYNGDFVLHFHHPSWRDRLDDPSSGFKPEFHGQ
jgi:hypothetical protein